MSKLALIDLYAGHIEPCVGRRVARVDCMLGVIALDEVSGTGGVQLLLEVEGLPPTGECGGNNAALDRHQVAVLYEVLGGWLATT